MKHEKLIEEMNERLVELTSAQKVCCLLFKL